MKFEDIIEFVIVFAFIFGILISWSSIKDTDKLTVFGKIFFEDFYDEKNKV